MNLSVTTKKHDTWTVVSVGGEIDVYTAPMLREKIVSLIGHGQYFLIIDMTGVNFLDSTGLGVLVGTLKRVRSHDGGMKIICTEKKIIKVFQITGLTQLFDMYESVDDALA